MIHIQAQKTPFTQLTASVSDEALKLLLDAAAIGLEGADHADHATLAEAGALRVNLSGLLL